MAAATPPLFAQLEILFEGAAERPALAPLGDRLSGGPGYPAPVGREIQRCLQLMMSNDRSR
jgi:hypothetical protein